MIFVPTDDDYNRIGDTHTSQHLKKRKRVIISVYAYQM